MCSNNSTLYVSVRLIISEFNLSHVLVKSVAYILKYIMIDANSILNKNLLFAFIKIFRVYLFCHHYYRIVFLIY